MNLVSKNIYSNLEDITPPILNSWLRKIKLNPIYLIKENKV